jgi:biotin-(acetyl-CoA carboxylase) ligase
MKLLFLFLTCACTISLPSYSDTPASAPQTELQQIDQEIESQKLLLKKLRKIRQHYEINAQPFMIDNWSEFADEIKSAEDSERAVLKTKQKVKELKERKELLLKQGHSQ